MSRSRMPIITYSGEESLFQSLEVSISQGLPLESVEWRRSYGRPQKNVCLEANFVPMREVETQLPKEGDWKLLGQAFFHTFWSTCNDSENYKTAVRDEINNWLSILRTNNAQDWIIIVVEAIDSQKGTKNKFLSRSGVVDKIRGDFCPKQPERCLHLNDLIKTDARSAESWQNLLHILRVQVLNTYNRHIAKFEEHMRSQRERRNDAGWSFNKYFLLQEELAFMFDMLKVYDEALVQYDELDALFSQFVLNSQVGDTPDWLSTYSKPCYYWKGIQLTTGEDISERSLIESDGASLLELRAYLFSQQCKMLFHLKKPSEVAQRTLPFLHNCLKELKILEVDMPVGSIACWVFLSCLEVVQTCSNVADSQTEVYLASLWDCSCQKLQELGNLCGLMPNEEASSEQLHLVVSLLAGMEEKGQDEMNLTPGSLKLREALSSKQNFEKHYLELSELAMVTYKHIGRIRSARLVGKELAKFYAQNKDHQKAVPYLCDALKTFQTEGWKLLAVQVEMELTECYRHLEDYNRYLHTCLLVSSSPLANPDDRLKFYQLAWGVVNKLEKVLLLPIDQLFEVESVDLVGVPSHITVGCNVQVCVTLNCNFPTYSSCQGISTSLQVEQIIPPKPGANVNNNAKSERSNSLSSDGIAIPEFQEHIDYKQDGSLNSASIVCSNPHKVLRRVDSHGTMRRHDKNTVEKEESEYALKSKSFSMQSGLNKVIVSCPAQSVGNHSLKQLSIQYDNVEFVLPEMKPKLCYSVVMESPKIYIAKVTKGDLVAGIEQSVRLIIANGSFAITEGTVVRLSSFVPQLLLRKSCSELQIEEFQNDLEVALPPIEPFARAEIPLEVIAKLLPHRDSTSVEHKINAFCPWSERAEEIRLYFAAPFVTSHKLHTAYSRKFLQVLVRGLSPVEFEISNHRLFPAENCKEDIDIVPLLPEDKKLKIQADQKVCYMWELLVQNFDTQLHLRVSFDYRPKGSGDAEENGNRFSSHTYTSNVDVNDYKTLYTVSSRIEPRGSEFCRANNICNMHVSITRENSSNFTILMYEVLADDCSWVACGKNAGVVTIDDTSGRYAVTLEVMPLQSGFLVLPNVRLSKYIPAEQKVVAVSQQVGSRDGTPTKKGIAVESAATSNSRLEPFSPGQVYNASKAMQVHVLPSSTVTDNQC